MSRTSVPRRLRCVFIVQARYVARLVELSEWDAAAGAMTRLISLETAARRFAEGNADDALRARWEVQS